LDVIAEVLRIRRRHLQAIEDGDFEQLPGTTYAVGFIRAYADYLGLDSDEVVRRFKEEQTTLQPGKPPKADLVFPSPMSESGIPRGAVVFLGVLIGVIAYGAWYSSTVDNDFFKKWIEPVPDRLAAMLPGKAETSAPDSSQAVASDKPAEAEASVTETTSPETTATETAVMSDEKPATETAAPAEPTAVEQQAVEQTAATGSETDTAGATAPAQETDDATPAPETVTAARGAPPSDVRPPESIAQPVETAELPAPQAEQAPAAEPTAEAAATEAVATEQSAAEQSRPPAASEQSSASDAAAQSAEATATSETATPETATPDAQTEIASTPNAPADADARIVLTAVSDSWVEVREMGTDTWVWGKLLRAGETYSVPDRPDLKMKTGNAGGLTITVDGAVVPPVGASGDVVRNILLDPDRLKAGTAVFR
jgi:cytoskeleton protein RodZ